MQGSYRTNEILFPAMCVSVLCRLCVFFHALPSLLVSLSAALPSVGLGNGEGGELPPLPFPGQCSDKRVRVPAAWFGAATCTLVSAGWRGASQSPHINNWSGCHNTTIIANPPSLLMAPQPIASSTCCATAGGMLAPGRSWSWPCSDEGNRELAEP